MVQFTNLLFFNWNAKFIHVNSKSFSCIYKFDTMYRAGFLKRTLHEQQVLLPYRKQSKYMQWNQNNPASDYILIHNKPGIKLTPIILYWHWLQGITVTHILVKYNSKLLFHIGLLYFIFLEMLVSWTYNFQWTYVFRGFSVITRFIYSATKRT